VCGPTGALLPHVARHRSDPAADVPNRFTRAFDEGASLIRRGRVDQQLAVPVGRGAHPVTLVLGRGDAFTERDVLRGVTDQGRDFAEVVRLPP
jgi:hypothetical protein